MAANLGKLLFVSPEVHPGTRKAKSIPILNPFDQYGRVFFFSWVGFMVAFLSWYAFPPLVSSKQLISEPLYTNGNGINDAFSSALCHY